MSHTHGGTDAPECTTCAGQGPCTRGDWSVFTTKDSGKREHFDSGMQRDTQEGKARFDLLLPEGVPYKAQLLTRWAELMERGARKYDARNWEQADSKEELDRARGSAFRHFMQWMTGETDEDHAAAVLFNVMVAETVKARLPVQEDPNRLVKALRIPPSVA